MANMKTYPEFVSWRCNAFDAQLPVEKHTRWYREQYQEYVKKFKEAEAAKPKPPPPIRKTRVHRLNLLMSAIEKEERTVDMERRLVEAVKKKAGHVVNAAFDLEPEMMIHNMLAGCLFDFANWLFNYQEEFATTNTERFAVAIKNFAHDRKLDVSDARTTTWFNYIIPAPAGEPPQSDMETEEEAVDLDLTKGE